MNKLLLIIPLLMGLDVGETSNHNDMLKPSLDAYEDFRKEGDCLSITRKRLSLVRQHKVDRDTVEVWGQGIRITCKRAEPVAGEPAGVVMVEFSWPPSLTRQNGDPLYCVKYRSIIGEHDTVTPGPSVVLAMAPGEYEIKYQAIDCEGLESGFIDPVAVRVTLND